MSDSTTTSATPEYVGRHRDESALQRGEISDYMARWFGYTYTPRHSASVHREVAS